MSLGLRISMALNLSWRLKLPHSYSMQLSHAQNTQLDAVWLHPAGAVHSVVTECVRESAADRCLYCQDNASPRHVTSPCCHGAPAWSCRSSVSALIHCSIS